MSHIQMAIAAARRHVKEVENNMFGIPRAAALAQLDTLEAAGDNFLRTESCPTFDTKSHGCRCGDQNAMEELIKQEDLTNL